MHVTRHRRLWLLPVIAAALLILSEHAGNTKASLSFLTERPDAIVAGSGATQGSSYARVHAMLPGAGGALRPAPLYVERVETVVMHDAALLRASASDPAQAAGSVRLSDRERRMLVAANRIASLIGKGREGQVLTIEDGRPVWRDAALIRTNVRLNAGGRTSGTGRKPYDDRFGGASSGEEPVRRYGGGGGNGGSTTNVTNVTNGLSQSDADGRYVNVTGDTMSGPLTVYGTISGASLVVSSTFEGAGLADCDDSTDKLVWDDATKTFSCATDNAVGTGLDVTTGDARYVNVSGDAMTGALTINLTSGTVGLEVIQTISGSTVFANASLRSSGSLAVEGAVSFASLASCTSLETDGFGNVICGTDDVGSSGTTVNTGALAANFDGRYVNVGGDTMTGALTINLASGTLGLEVIQTISGSTIFANTSLRSSGSLAVEGITTLAGATEIQSTLEVLGTISGANLFASKSVSGTHLYAASTFGGAGLADCDTAGTSKLLWDAATKTFSCGTDSAGSGVSTGALAANFDGRYVNVGGDTMTGALTINLTSGTVGLEVIQTISGSTIFANNRLVSSGTLVTESGATFDGGTLHVAAGPNRVGVGTMTPRTALEVLGTISGAALFTSGDLQSRGTGYFDGPIYGAYTAASGDAFFVGNDTKLTDINISNTLGLYGQQDSTTAAIRLGSGGPTVTGRSGNLGVGVSAPETALEVLGTVSGSDLFSSRSVSGTHLYAASTFGGAGLADCDTAGTSKLLWDATTKRFSCGTDQSGGGSSNTGALAADFNGRYVNVGGDTMTGALTINLTTGTVGLEVIQTISGSTIFANTSVRSSGSLAVEGATTLAGATEIQSTLEVLSTISGADVFASRSVSGTHLYAATTFGGAGLADCDAEGQTLGWDATTKRFTCGVDETAGSGLDINTADARYVKKQGDTMTGALVINLTSGTVGLEVIQTISGSTIFANASLRSSGSLAVEGITTLAGATEIQSTLEVLSTISGANIFGSKSVSGTHLYAASTFGGAGLADCDTAGTSKLLWDAATKTFSCGTDQTSAGSSNTGALAANFDGRYVNVGGDTMTGALTINVTSATVNTVGLKVVSTISGAIIRAQKALAASGTLAVDGAATFNSTLRALGAVSETATGIDRVDIGVQVGTPRMVFEDAGSTIWEIDNEGGTFRWFTPGQEHMILTSTDLTLNDDLQIGNASADAVTVQSSTWTFANDTNFALSGGQNGLSFDTNTLSINSSANRVGIGTTAPNTTLEVLGTASGRNLFASFSVTGSHLYAATTFGGAGLADCDTAATSKLLWDATTKRFSCGTDQTGGGNVNTGALAANYDGRYVNVGGDTMTGALTINLTSGTVGLEVIQTISGSTIFANTSLRSSGSLAVEGTTTLAGATEIQSTLEVLSTISGANIFASKSLSGTHLYAASTFGGAGLADCDTSGTSKLLWDATTKTFSCGTDQNTGAIGTATFSGAVRTLSEDRYVNVAGDTMTGALVIKKLAGTATGSILVVDTQGLVYDATNKRVGVGTASPKATLGVSGTISGSALTVVGGSSYFLGAVGIGTTAPGANGINNPLLELMDGDFARLSLIATDPATDVRGIIDARGDGTDRMQVGTASAHDLLFFTNDADRFTIESDGSWTLHQDTNVALSGGTNGISFDGTTLSVDGSNDRVGIGTAAPNFPLDVITTSVWPANFARSDNTTAGITIGQRIGNAGTALFAGYRTDIDAGYLQGFNYGVGAENLILQGEGGFVGIGSQTTAPQAYLHILTETTGASEAMRLTGQAGATGYGPLLRFTNTHASGLVPNAGEYNLAGILGYDYDNVWGGALAFQTAPAVSQGGQLVTRMTIDQVGDVGIDTETPGSKLSVSGSAIIGSGIGSAAADTALEVIGTMSGMNLWVARSVSGAHLYASSTFAGAGLTDCDASSSKLVWDATAKQFSCGTISGTSVNTGALAANFDGRYVNIGGDTMTGALTINLTSGTVGLEVIQTISGSTVFANTSLRSSGSLVVEGSMSGQNLFVARSVTGAHLYAATTFGGAGLADCDTAGTSKLLWDATTKTFSCGTDQTGGGTGTNWSNTGSLARDYDGRYVNVGGDTMTGALTINVTGGTTATQALKVIQMISGAVLSVAGGNVTVSNSGTTVFNEFAKNVDFRIEGVNNASLFYLDASANRIGIGRNAPRTTFEVGGTLSGASLIVSGNAAFAGSGIVLSSSGQTVFNEQSRNVDFRIEGDSNANLFFLDASLDRVGIGTNAPKSAFNVAGTMSGSALVITGTMSGRSLLITGTGSRTGNGTPILATLASRGAVGIGTNSPTERLTVGSGNVLVAPGGNLLTLGGLDPTAAVYDIDTQGKYAYIALSSATGNDFRIVELSQATSPSTEGGFDFGGDVRAVAVEGRYAYVGLASNASYGEIVVLDVTNPSSPTLVSSFELGRNVLDLQVVNGVAYVATSSTFSDPEFLTLDVSDPFRIRQLWSGVTILSDVNAVHVNGRYAYVAGGSSFYLYDVQNPSDPVLRSTTVLTSTVYSVYVSGKHAYVGVAGNVGSELLVYDVSDPASPSQVGSLEVGADVYSVVVGNRHAYVGSSTVTGFDLRVVDVSNPSSPRAVAGADVSTGVQSVAFAGKQLLAGLQSAAGNDFRVFDLPGLDAPAAAIGAISTNFLSVAENAIVANSLTVGNALTVGLGGINSQGPLTILTGSGGNGMTGALIRSRGKSGTLLALDAYTNSGSKTPHIMFGYKGTFDIAMHRKGTGALRVASVTGTILTLDSEMTNTTNVLRIVSDYTSDENTVFRVQADGQVYAEQNFNSGGADYAEYFYSSTPDLKQGEVVCIDVRRENAVKRCERPADGNVIGIVSHPKQAAFIGNKFKGLDGLPVPGTVLVGLLGQVKTHVLVESGATIRPGDALTSASKPGFARKARAGESTVGVALQPLAKGEGYIDVLISRRNQSLTVEAVEEKVLKTVAALEIEDEVQLMVAQAMEGLDLDVEVKSRVADEIGAMDLDGRIARIVDERLAARPAAPGEAPSDDVLLSLLDRIAALEAKLAGSGVTMDDLLRDGSLTVENAFTAAGDARIGGDLYLEGALVTDDLFVPGSLGVDGLLTVNGDLALAGRLTLPADAALSVADLTVENALYVMGDVTIDGLARFLGDVEIRGELRVNPRQAGRATVEAGARSVTVLFQTGFTAAPVVTASTEDFVLSPWRVKPVTQTGFVIELRDATEEAVTFAWHALVPADGKGTLQASAAEVRTPFPVDASGYPVSSNEIWNGCIRNRVTLDASGQPYSCARYHVDNEWTHPDLNVTFTFNDALTPPYIELPEGYESVVTQAASSSVSSEAVSSSASSVQASSVQSSPEASSEAVSSSASSAEAPAGTSSVAPSSVAASSQAPASAQSATADAAGSAEASVAASEAPAAPEPAADPALTEADVNPWNPAQ